MSDPSVNRWLPGASSGDADALNEVIRHYRPAIYRYCRARLPHHEAAEDVTQEVTIAMVEALPRHRAAEHELGAFVFGIASNKVAMWHRSSYRRPEAPIERRKKKPKFAIDTPMNPAITNISRLVRRVMMALRRRTSEK